MPCGSLYCEPFVRRQVSGDSNGIITWARVWNVEVDPGTLLTFLRPVGQAPTPNERLLGGCNSVVEYLLPKQKVVGSNPITRSKSIQASRGILKAPRKLRKRTKCRQNDADMP